MRMVIKKMKQGKIVIGERYWGIGYSNSDKKFILDEQRFVDQDFSNEITAKTVRQQRGFRTYDN